MMAWKAKRIFVLLLGVWVALAPAMFAVPAAAMPVQTSMSGDTGFNECDLCPENEADRSICTLMCFNATLLATLLERGKLSYIAHEEYQPARHPALLGRLSTPDPAPPKVVSLL